MKLILEILQRIIASISSEELAGSEVKVEYKPTSRAGAYPLPSELSAAVFSHDNRAHIYLSIFSH